MLSARQVFLQNLAQTTDFPLMLEVERAEGVYFYSPKGKRYLDLISGISVSNIGHRHPKVLAAIRKQLDKYLHVMVYGELIQSPQNQLAQQLVENTPAPIDNVYFVNSGSEAIEAAMKLAKRHTGRSEIVACHKAYHGSSQGALSLNGEESFKQNYRPLLPGIRHINYGSFSDLERIITQDTAAVIMETVQGEAGVIAACTTYFKSLREHCDATGTLLILDEIQTGFGRTGKLWGFEHFDIVPDMFVCAKGMGGGMPIGALLAPREMMGAFKENPILGHITTFGGHPVSCAASLATLEVLKETDLIDQVESKADLFRQKLKHPAIKYIRNKGLLMAIEFESFELLKAIIDRAIELGVLTDWFLFNDCSMRVAPPLIINEIQIKEACQTILQAIDEVLEKA